MADASYIIKRYTKAKQARANWLDVWQECYEYSLPLREGFFMEAPAQSRMDKIFDETAVVGVQEFASRLQYGIVPNYATWFRLEPGSDIPLQLRNKVQTELDEITEYVGEIIQNSNFSQEVHESFLDLAVGTANMLIEEGNETNPIKFLSVPLSQTILDSGPFDQIDGVFRERSVKAKDILTVWPKAKLSEALKAKMRNNPEANVPFIDAVYRDWTDRSQEVHNYCVIDLESQTKIIEGSFKGEGSRPWVNFRWSKAAGEIYGRGPLMNALPAIKVCNLTMQLVLENAQMAIGGIWQADDDGVINVDTIQLIPGTIVPRSPNSRGLEAVQSPAKFDVSQLIIENMQQNIKRALYNQDLGRTDTTPMSATEVAARQSNLAEIIGSAYGRLQAEFVNPVLRRVISILKKQGKIEIPKVDGREVKIVAKSPLARAQRNQDIMQLTNFIALVTQTMGPQAASQFISPDETIKKLAEWYEIPQKILIDETQRMMMQRQAQQQAMAMEQQAPGSVIEMAQAAKGMMP
jgi:hypothetical protein